jgi:hypothetical protein
MNERDANRRMPSRSEKCPVQDRSAIEAQRIDAITGIAIGMLAVALLLEAVDRRRSGGTLPLADACGSVR